MNNAWKPGKSMHRANARQQSNLIHFEFQLDGKFDNGDNNGAHNN
jgi:hypothetical protein